MKKNWKTTFAGIAGAALLAFGPSVGARLSGSKDIPPITFGNYGPAIAMALLGINAKDHDVSGGTR